MNDLSLRVLGRERGFSLIEMMVVLAILAIIVTMAVSSYLAKSSSSTKLSACRANLKIIDGAIQSDRATTGSYPTTLGDLLVDGYLKKVPTEPFGGSYALSPGGESSTCSEGHTY